MPVQQNDIPTIHLGEKEISSLPTLKIADPAPVRAGARLTRYGWLELVLSAAVLLMIFVIIWAEYPDLPYYYRYTWKPVIATYWPNALAVIALLVIGYNLYIFRGYLRLWFGLAEIALAAGLGWYAVNKIAAGAVSDAIVVLFAALYLAGRGFVNISHRFTPFQIRDQGEK